MKPRIMLVGPSARFMSGITYYTYSLANALAETADLSVLLMRRLLPRFLYPGSGRVGGTFTGLTLPRRASVFDGVDYFWIPSLFRARKFLREQRPEVLVLQWWTGTVLHSYLALARAAKRHGARVVIEFHETLDPGEQKRRLFHAYVNRLAPQLFAKADAFVVHSVFDRRLVCERYGLDAQRVMVIPHATYSHYQVGSPRPNRSAEEFNLLFFGLIRPVKGLEYLLDAFDRLPREVADLYRLTIVGEPWEGCDALVAGIAGRRNAHRITVVNRYVTDEEADEHFRAADAVVLPYVRCSQSGVLHIAMAYRLPVIASAIGGIPEALEGYGSYVLTAPGDVDSLTNALARVRNLDIAPETPLPRWDDSADALCTLVRKLTGTPQHSANRENESGDAIPA
jgi:glycosyltransferase involved in cell wall biosynthesis